MRAKKANLVKLVGASGLWPTTSGAASLTRIPFRLLRRPVSLVFLPVHSTGLPQPEKISSFPTPSGYIRVFAMVHEQMMIAGRAAAQKVVRDHQRQKNNELAQRQHKVEVERYLLWNVQRTLKSYRQLRTAGFGLHGQILERAREISADIRVNLFADNDPNAFTATQRVRALVDRWFDSNLKDEECVDRYVDR